jgi:hypothetical protein
MSHRFAKQFQFNTAALHKKYVTSASEWTCRAWAHNTGSKILNLSDYLIIFLTLMKTGVLCICRAIVRSCVDIGTTGGISRVRAEEVAKGRGWSVTTTPLAGVFCRLELPPFQNGCDYLSLTTQGDLSCKLHFKKSLSQQLRLFFVLQQHLPQSQ